MTYPNYSPEEQKILELIYSNVPTNDLLALEIIRNGDYGDKFLGALVGVFVSTEDLDGYEEIKEYLRESIQDYVLRQSPFVSNRRSRMGQSFLRFFKKETCVEVAYTHFRRTGAAEAIDLFLDFDNNEHPFREKILEAYIEKSKYSSKIWIKNLFSKEIAKYLESVFPLHPKRMIRELQIDSLKSNDLPEILFSRPYKVIRINTRGIKEFPEYIFNFKDVKTLSIHLGERKLGVDRSIKSGLNQVLTNILGSHDSETKPQINTNLLEDSNLIVIPSDWSAINSLTELRFSGSGYVFKQIDFVKTLPNLKNLNISSHAINNAELLLTDLPLPLSGERGYLKDKSGEWLEIKCMISRASNISKALRESILSLEEQIQYLLLLITKLEVKDVEITQTYDILALMNVNYKPLRLALHQQIQVKSEMTDSKELLKKGNLLYLAGRFSRTKTEIKAKLKEIGVALTNDPKKAITHIVIGKNPKQYQAFKDQEVGIVSEQQLYDLFQKDAPKFIELTVESGDDAIEENILQLLHSEESNNVQIALEMLKNGGVPDTLIDPLLVVQKTSPDSKIRKSAKELLLRVAPPIYLPLLQDSQRFTNLQSKKAQEINKKLEKLAKAVSPEMAAKLSLLFHEQFKLGLRYILYHFKTPSTTRTAALKAMTEGTHFDFSTGLGFTDWRNTDPEEVYLYNMRAEAKFPMDILDHVSLIESADFHNCKFGKLPKDIGKFKDLKKLDLSYNFLATFPKSVEEMTQLEYLDLRMNRFTVIPATLKRIPQLKVLDLRYNRVDGIFQAPEVPEEVAEALKDCEIRL